MSEEKAPEQKPAESAPAAKADAPAAPRTYAPDEVEKILAASRSNAADAKELRGKLEAIEKAKADADKAKMEAEGNLKGLLDAERKRVEELTAKAAKADEYGAAFADRIARASSALSDADKALVAGLPPLQALALAERLAAPAAGTARAPTTTAGNPAGPVIPQNLATMSPAELRAHMAALTPGQLRELGEKQGVSAGPRPGFQLPFKKG